MNPRIERRSDTMAIERPKDRDQADLARRAFLESCGKFAVVTPPAISLLLSTSLASPAVAASGGSSASGGGGNCGVLCQIGNLFD
jgi:hypothetical protein